MLPLCSIFTQGLRAAPPEHSNSWILQHIKFPPFRISGHPSEYLNFIWLGQNCTEVEMLMGVRVPALVYAHDFLAQKLASIKVQSQCSDCDWLVTADEHTRNSHDCDAMRRSDILQRYSFQPHRFQKSHETRAKCVARSQCDGNYDRNVLPDGFTAVTPTSIPFYRKHALEFMLFTRFTKSFQDGLHLRCSYFHHNGFNRYDIHISGTAELPVISCFRNWR